MKQLLFNVDFSSESQKKNNEEYKIAQVVIRSDVDEIATKNSMYVSGSQEYRSANKNDFKMLLNSKYPQFKSTLARAINEDTIESGVHYYFEEKFGEYFKEYPYMAIKLLEYFLRDYYTDTKKVKAILHIVSHYTYEELGEDFAYPIISLVNHCNKGIKKFALKVFDNWDSVETLQLLKGTQNPNERWLREYKERIIERLERKNTDAIFFTSD